MLVIYVAGPYRAESPWETEQNIRRAETVANWIWERGHVALCPHTNARYASALVPDANYLAGTMELMRRCDGVIVLPRWESSEGTCGEIMEATRLEKPVARLEMIMQSEVHRAIRCIEAALKP